MSIINAISREGMLKAQLGTRRSDERLPVITVTSARDVRDFLSMDFADQFKRELRIAAQACWPDEDFSQAAEQAP